MLQVFLNVLFSAFKNGTNIRIIILYAALRYVIFYGTEKEKGLPRKKQA